MRVDVSHVRAGCNPTVGAVSWGPGSVVACGAHSSVLLYDTQV